MPDKIRSYAELWEFIRISLRIQHPEWIEPNGDSPICDSYQARLWHIRNTPITGSHVFVAYRLADGSEWIVDNENPQPKKVPPEASPMQLVFLLSGDLSAPVDVVLQNGLDHLSYF